MYHDTYVWIGTLNPLSLLLVGLVSLLVIFIPSFVAVMRDHPSRMAILILNILFGWTGLGWIILLIWSFSSQSSVSTHRWRHL